MADIKIEELPEAKKAEPGKDPKPETPKEDIGSIVRLHYDDANKELTTRIAHKERGFDVYDRVYRNYIELAKWPFAARVPDGRGATLLRRKTDRLLASKLQGKLIPRRYGSELGAKVGTELLLYQWTEADMQEDEPMIMKWRRMDHNARKYGASFAFVPWHTAGSFDGPWFEPLEARDVLTQPGVRSIGDSEWIQVRRYPTLTELKVVNDRAKTGPIYDVAQLKDLEDNLGKGGADNNYISINKTVIGLGGSSTQKDRIEMITEYRRDRWITFLPKKNGGKAILRDIKNPYDHGQIPIIRLVYDVIDDDIYGVPELENVLPLIKTNWALMSQYLEQAQNELYTPLMVNPTAVQLDTLTFKSGARWLMNKPGQDVMPFKQGAVSMQQFIQTYQMISALIMEGIGETGQDISQISQGQSSGTTATEIRDLALMRSARDNANKTLLSQAIAKMIWFWFKMDQQFIDGYKLVRIVGQDAMKYLVDEGLHGYALSDDGLKKVYDCVEETGEDFDTCYEKLRLEGALEEFMTPLYPVQPDANGVTIEPQLQLEKDGRTGFLSVSKKDIQGDYDFIPDIEAMSMPNDQAEVTARQMLFDSTFKVKDDLAGQGYVVKWKDLIQKIGDVARVRDMDQFFEKTPATNPNVNINQQPDGNIQPGQGDVLQRGAGTPTGAGAPPQGAGIPVPGLPQQ